jgi:hypothetical protein
MPPRETVAPRPRGTVEILDDAWRIAFADLPLLLSLCALFVLPALAIVLLLVCLPLPETWWARPLLPAAAALALTLTGLSAGACQEAFHSWAEGYPVRFGECMWAALKRGLNHGAAQAVALATPVMLAAVLLAPSLGVAVRVVVPMMALPAWYIWSCFGLCRHPSFAAGQPRFGRAFRYALRAGGWNFGPACLLQFVRFLVFAFALLNLHLFWNFGLWAAENFAGFDVAWLGVLCSLTNPVYLLALAGMTAWLVMPFFEAGNYLYFLDARTRYEGLDLLQRVEDLFPARPRVKAGAVFLALGLALAAAGPARAEAPLAAVQGARRDVAVIRTEVEAAQPYPGGKRWLARLTAIHDRLDKSLPKPGGYRWLKTAIDDFPHRNQPQALAWLDDVDTRLGLIEESLSRPRREGAAEPDKDYLKGLVPPDTKSSDKKPRRPLDDVDDRPQEKGDEDRDGQAGGRLPSGGPRMPGVVAPAGLGAIAYPILVLLVGLIGAALVAGIAWAVYRWWQERARAAPRKVGALPPRPEAYLDDPDQQNVPELWRQADERAQAGDFLGAVRTIYLAVLAFLHQGGLIRYERTRTNGEYADHLRPRRLLHRPFVGLTGIFEVKWYGERACEAEDYAACRELAEEIRGAGAQGNAA